MTLSSTDTLACDTLPSLLRLQAENNKTATALRSKNALSGAWESLSWGDYYHQVQKLRLHMAKLGLQPGQTVGFLAPSSPYWDLAQMGVLAARGIVVGMDPGDQPDRLNQVATQCGFTGLVVNCAQDVERFSEKCLQHIEFVIFLQDGESDTRGTLLSRLLLTDPGEGLPETPSAMPDDIATIIFTSGTTGEPKGIEYSHRQICTALSSIREALPDMDSSYRLACWLPLSNMFQRIINFLGMSCAAETWYVSNPQLLMQEIREIEPHMFIGVPRFYEKLHRGIFETLESKPRWQQRVAAWALRAGQAYQREVRKGATPGPLVAARYLLADRLVLSSARKVMGANLRYMISGSAPMPLWLLEDFHAFGLLVLEAYGLSENVIPNAMNRPLNYRFGTVGLPLTGCEIRPAPDGELLVRGPGVIQHYFRSEEQLLNPEGFLATGDFGSVDQDGYVALLGRKSEIIKTSTGRRIAPAPVEAVLLQHPLVEQALVVGRRQQFLTAIIVLHTPTPETLQACAEQCCNELKTLLQVLPPYSRPAGLVITTRAFSVEAGEVTNNMKLRRKVIKQHYKMELESIYSLVNKASDNDGRKMELFADQENTVLCKL